MSFELFVCTHDLLASGLDENVYANRLQLAALRTAQLLALRTLIAFFENDSGGFESGVIASTYVADWDPDDDGGRRLRDLRNLKQRINERVAHVDAERHRSGQAPIPKDSTIWKSLNVLMARFYERLDDRWKSMFYGSLEQARHSIHDAGRDGPVEPLLPGGSVSVALQPSATARH